MQLARAKAKQIALLAAALLLTACATTAPPPPPAAPAPTNPPASPAPPPTEPAQPPEPALPPIAMPEMMAPPPPPVRMPPPPPTDAQSLRAAYGTPDFIRKEMDSELWRYDGRNCAAFFFLYREGDVMRIRYTETNPRGRNAVADPDCLESLSGRPGRPMS